MLRRTNDTKYLRPIVLSIPSFKTICKVLRKEWNAKEMNAEQKNALLMSAKFKKVSSTT